MEYNSLLSLIGHTPLVRLNHVVPNEGPAVFAKLESFNPGRSVKDRAAFHMLLQAKAYGQIDMNSTIIEPTSGNTGIGLAMASAALDLRCLLVMPASMSQERVALMKAYGAEVVLSEGRMPEAIAKAVALQKSIPGSFMPQQFENQENPNAHRGTTALEIIEDLDGQVDVFVATAGTGGTITGTGEVLKEHVPRIYIVAVEPFLSPVLSGGKPGPHGIAGMGPGFIPKILNVQIFDEIVAISDDEAYAMSRKLAQTEGILVGASSGAAVAAAAAVAKKRDRDENIVVLCPDTGERYLSTGLFP